MEIAQPITIKLYISKSGWYNTKRGMQASASMEEVQLGQFIARRQNGRLFRGTYNDQSVVIKVASPLLGFVLLASCNNDQPVVVKGTFLSRGLVPLANLSNDQSVVIKVAFPLLGVCVFSPM